MKKLWTLVIVAALALPLFAGGDGAGVARRIAVAHGLERFGDIDALRYTFNVTSGGKSVRREWTWMIKENKVAYRGLDASGKPVELSYKHWAIPDSLRPLDAWFVNDQYWLLFPFHLVWDAGARLTDDGFQSAPVDGARYPRLGVNYDFSAGGYTPGDSYDLFYHRDFLLSEWIYSRRGDRSKGRPATWEGYADVGPLVLSLEHRGEAGADFHLWFTDVAVKLAGDKDWREAKPR